MSHASSNVDRAEAAAPARRPAGWLAVLVLALTFLAYGPSLENGFVNLDDAAYITRMPSLAPRAVAEVFTRPFEGYHPLTILSLGLDFRLAGANPWLYHFVNLLLHLANTAFVFWLAWRLAGTRLVAFVTALIFGLHPVHVEAVAWVSARKDVLYAFFYLPALLAWTHYARGGGAGWFLATLGLFALSALSKGMAVSLPLSLLCLDYALGRRLLSRRVLLEKIPFLALAALCGWAAVQGQKAGTYLAEPRPLGVTLAGAAYGFWQYALHLIAPLRLSAHYPPPPSLARWHGWEPVVYALLGVALAGVLIRYRARRLAVFGALFFAANIALVLQFLPVADFLVADRYNYLSAFGFCLLIGLAAARVLTSAPALRAAMAATLALYALALGLLTRDLCRVWKDSVTLWTDVIAKQRQAVFALNMRGCAYNDLGRPRDAVADFERAIRLAPALPRSYLNRGYTRYRLRDLDGALQDFNQALALKPDSHLALNDRGLVWRDRGDLAAALADFNQAVALAGRQPGAHLLYGNRAGVRLRLGDFAGADADASRALALKPGWFPALVTRATARGSLEDLRGSLADWSAALMVDGADANAWRGLAAAQARLGMTNEAAASGARAAEAERATAKQTPD